MGIFAVLIAVMRRYSTQQFESDSQGSDMKRSLLGLSLLALSSTSFAVPGVDVDVSAGIWQATPEGTVGKTETDIEALGLEEENGNVLSVTLEHPVPSIPNIRIKRTTLDFSGSGTLDEAFTFDDVTFPVSEKINSDIDLSHTDFTLFYGLPELVVDLDLGLTARVFDGKASAVTTSLEESADLDFAIPMAFASVRIDLPLTGLYIGAEGNMISYDDNELTDLEAKVGYSTNIVPLVADLELEVGYRSLDLKIDDDDLEADITVDGPFANVRLAF